MSGWMCLGVLCVGVWCIFMYVGVLCSFVYLSNYPSIYLSIILSIYDLHPFDCVSGCISMFVLTSVRLSVCHSIYPFIHLSVRPSVHPPVSNYFSRHINICLFVLRMFTCCLHMFTCCLHRFPRIFYFTKCNRQISELY